MAAPAEPELDVDEALWEKELDIIDCPVVEGI